MTGLVFAGGGAKGAYQIGVWKALNELNIEIGLVVGTSVGALNGALYAQKYYDEAVNLWENMTMESVFNADEDLLIGMEKTFNKQIFKNNIAFYRKLYSYVTEHKGFDITPLRKTIQNLLDEDVIRNSGIDFGFVTYNLNDHKPLKLFVDDIPKDEIKYYLLGSALVPGFSQDKEFPVKFVDGGIHDRFPIQMAIDKGYKDIIAVETRQNKLKAYKAADITYIVPSEDTGNFLIFDKNQSLRNFEMGYLDALKVLTNMPGQRYYFKEMLTEKQIIREIIKIKPKRHSELFSKARISRPQTLKSLFDTEIPALSKKVLKKDFSTYQEIFIGLIEYLLDVNEVERLKVYTLEEVSYLINKAYDDDSLAYKAYQFVKLIIM